MLERPLCWQGLCDYRHEHDVGLVVGEMLSDKCLGIFKCVEVVHIIGGTEAPKCGLIVGDSIQILLLNRAGF